MKVLLVRDQVPDGFVVAATTERFAAKAVVIREDGLMLLLASSNADVLKFPGGGIESGEDETDALARELAEECGVSLIAVGEVVVEVVERRIDNTNSEGVFTMRSAYRCCEVSEISGVQRLDAYESELQLVPEWVSPVDAVTRLRRALISSPELAWVPRELAVLEALKPLFTLGSARI